jgi:nucleoside-diphosphate-sugar epimerase
MKKILILGGTKFLGKSLVKYLNSQNNFTFFLANRGKSGQSDIFIDRENYASCQILKEYKFDAVIDLSCYTKSHFENTYKNLTFLKYIFISSSAVEAIPFINAEPDMLEIIKYAYNKKECEDFIIKNIKDYFIIRPCYIVGENDYTNRFYRKNNKYYWNNGTELTYYIEVENLVKIIVEAIESKNNKIINPCT